MWSGPVRPPRPFRSKTVDASGARDDSLLYTRCTCVCVCVLRWEGKRAVQPRKQQKKNTCCLHCTVSRCSSTNPFTFCVFLISTRQRDSCAFVRCVGKAINQSVSSMSCRLSFPQCLLTRWASTLLSVATHRSAIELSLATIPPAELASCLLRPGTRTSMAST